MMKRRGLALSIFLFSAVSSLQAQSIDSLVASLPSSREYFSPRAVTDSVLRMEEETVSALSSYLYEGVVVPSRFNASSLGKMLMLPKVVRPIHAPRDLPFSISLIPSPSRATLFSRETQSLLERYRVAQAVDEQVLQHLQANNYGEALYTTEELLRDKTSKDLDNIGLGVGTMVAGKIDPVGIKAYADRFSVEEIERKYWIPGFESSIQFSQNYISDNWYKGGNSNMNLSMRTYFSLLYRRDRVQWLNELESKLGIYTATQGSTGAKYRISEDLLRLHSNYGIKASKRWSYTVDGELRTQLFLTYNNDRSVLQSAPWAPIRTNLGIGMKYSYQKKSKTRYGRQVSLSLNLAPLSYNWRWSGRDDIDLARHGLKERMSVHTLGSTLRGELKCDFNMDISWISRAYFNTSYKNTELEWENTLVMRISRYFSTRINVHLRYDDSSRPSDSWNRHIQINELLSFGFNYKL